MLEFRCLSANSFADSAGIGLCQYWNLDVLVQDLVPEEFKCLFAGSCTRVQMPVQCEWVNASAGIHMSLCKFVCQSSHASSV